MPLMRSAMCGGLSTRQPVRPGAKRGLCVIHHTQRASYVVPTTFDQVISDLSMELGNLMLDLPINFPLIAPHRSKLFRYN